MWNITSLWQNHWVRKITDDSDFWRSVKEYIDACNEWASEKWFRIIPYPSHYIMSQDGKNYMWIWEWQYIIFTIEIWKLNVKWILECCESDSEVLQHDEIGYLEEKRA